MTMATTCMANNSGPPAHQVNLGSLPDEVLGLIFAFVAPRDNLLGLQRVSWSINRVANQNLLWKSHCLSTFIYWDFRVPANSEIVAKGAQADWKALYRSRATKQMDLANFFESFITMHSDRRPFFPYIVRYGYDAKDFLLDQCLADRHRGNGLASRYFAKLALDSIHRDMAITEWSNLVRDFQGQAGAGVSTTWRRRERAVAAFNLFVLHDGPGDLDETTSQLDQLTSSFLEANPGFERSTTRDKALALLSWFHKTRLVGNGYLKGIETLRSGLLGQALWQESHEANPDIASVLYCGLANRLGLDAYRGSLPSPFTVIIRSPPGFTLDGSSVEILLGGYKPKGSAVSPTHLFLAPSEQDSEVPEAFIRRTLSLTGSDPLDEKSFLSLIEPSPLMKEMRMFTQKLRSQVDLLAHPQVRFNEKQAPFLRGHADSNARACRYAALWAEVILRSTEDPDWPAAAQALSQEFTQLWPEDQWLIEKHLAPLYRELDPYGPSLSARFENDWAQEEFRELLPDPMRFLAPDAPFKPGQVFRHRRQDWIGVVIFWRRSAHAWTLSPTTSSSRHYFLSLQENAPRTLFVANASSMKLITDPNLVDLDAFPGAGQYFQRFDKDTCSFIPLPDSLQRTR